jgi:hypothetical protein
MATPQEHLARARDFQEVYDKKLCSVGVRVPGPLLGQTVNDYRRETCRTLKRQFLPQVHPLYKVNYRSLPDEALSNFEKQLIPACIQEANNPAHVPPGQFKEIKRYNEYGQHQFTDFIGPESFVRGMMRAGRRVLGFRTPHGLEITKR